MISTSTVDTFSLFSNKQLIGNCLDHLQNGLKEGLAGMVKAALSKGETMTQYNLTAVPYHSTIKT